MPKFDAYELTILKAYEKGQLKSVASKRELAKFKATARATATKDCRINIRLSSADLHDIQTRALEEGIPYQTLIASVLHKYVTGRYAEHSAPPPGQARKKRTAKRRPVVGAISRAAE